MSMAYWTRVGIVFVDELWAVAVDVFSLDCETHLFTPSKPPNG